MSSSKNKLKQIKNTFIRGLACECLSFIIIVKSNSLFENFTIEVPVIAAIFSRISFMYGYGICIQASFQYAKRRGYSNYFGLFGILNFHGLSICFR